MATRENIKWLKTDLHTCGLNRDNLSELLANLDKIINVNLDISSALSARTRTSTTIGVFRSMWHPNTLRVETPKMAQPMRCRFKDNQYHRLEGGIVPISVCL